jgi:site-specific recombinase XerD
MENPNVLRWYENLLASSAHTAIPRLYRLSKICERLGLNPESLAKLPQKELEDSIQDTVRQMEKEGKSADYIHGVITAVKSWLKHNEREIKRDIKIRGLGESRVQATEKIPDYQQMEKLFLIASQRAKVSISFLAFGGFRPEVLGNRDGTAGLTLGDIPELEIDNLKLQAPAQVIVRRELSKVRHQYFSFVNQTAVDYLLQYLEARRAAGENLTKNSPVIVADWKKSKSAEIKFLCTQNITDEIRRLFKKIKLQQRPYVLRSYFATHLLEAELDGKISTDIRAFFEGHKGTIERVYTIGKHNLSKEMFAKVKQQYVNSNAYLDGSIINLLKESEIENKFKMIYESQVQAKLNELQNWQNQLIKTILQANIGDETKLNLSKLITA